MKYHQVVFCSLVFFVCVFWGWFLLFFCFSSCSCYVLWSVCFRCENQGCGKIYISLECEKFKHCVSYLILPHFLFWKHLLYSFFMEPWVGIYCFSDLMELDFGLIIYNPLKKRHTICGTKGVLFEKGPFCISVVWDL